MIYKDSAGQLVIHHYPDTTVVSGNNLQKNVISLSIIFSIKQDFTHTFHKYLKLSLSNFFFIEIFSHPRNRETKPLPEKKTSRRRIIEPDDSSTSDDQTDNDHERPGTSRKRPNSPNQSRTSNAQHYSKSI